MDVDAWKEKAKKYRDQSFTVKTNEAYKALQHEIEHAEGEVAQAEERLLVRMVDGEQYDRDVKAAEQDLKELERTVTADRQKIQAEQAALQQELTAKQAERDQMIPAIPEELLSTYDRIAARHHGIGVAAVLGEACSLCGLARCAACLSTPAARRFHRNFPVRDLLAHPLLRRASRRRFSRGHRLPHQRMPSRPRTMSSSRAVALSSHDVRAQTARAAGPAPVRRSRAACAGARRLRRRRVARQSRSGGVRGGCARARRPNPVRDRQIFWPRDEQRRRILRADYRARCRAISRGQAPAGSQRLRAAGAGRSGRGCRAARG
jgi:hypothetical protein